MSVRGLFEEIKFLKKENLDLKLKIYFLEDSNSQSNKIKELMDYNVKLKMEVDDSNAEVERKKMLIEETIGILDVQQTKLDEYEKKIAFLGRIETILLFLAKQHHFQYFLEQTCEEMRTEILESNEQEFESRGSTPTPLQQDKHISLPIVDEENFNFTRFEDKMEISTFGCAIL